MSSAPDHIYLDLFAVNNDTTGSGVRTNLNFTETRTNNILDNPSNYFLSVARFEADTPAVSLPIFIPALAIDGVNADPNKTCYYVTMAIPNPATKKLQGVVTQAVYWTPEDQTAAPPNNKIVDGYLSTQDITTGYYNCYNVKWWLACVNKALLQCWSLISGQTGTVAAASAPTIVVDAGTNLMTLLTPISLGSPFNFAQNEFSATGNGSDPIYLGLNAAGTVSTPSLNYCLFMNEPLFNLFSGFPSVYYGNSLTASAFSAGSNVLIADRYWLFNYYVLPILFQNNNIITLQDLVGSKTSWVSTDSEYSPVPMWNPIASLIFTSSLLPITMSMTSLPQVYNSNIYDQTYANNGNNAQISSMISDIQVGLVSGSEYKPSVLYVPSAEYRLIDMLGNNPLYQASFGIGWKTKFGQVIAFQLGAQCGANLKILFRRKRFNLGNLAPYDTN